VTSRMGSATITDIYLRDACLYSGLDLSTFAASSSGAALPFTSCCIASSISGSGVEPVLFVGCGAVLAAVADLERDAEAAAVGADFDDAVDVAALRVRVVAVAVGFGSSGPALAAVFLAEAAVVLVEAERVAFFTAGAGVSAGSVAVEAAAAFFLGVLAGAAPAVLFVLIFFLGTLSAAVLLAALAGFAAVDASRNGCGLHVGIGATHRTHRPRSCGLRTREDIVRLGVQYRISCCNQGRDRTAGRSVKNSRRLAVSGGISLTCLHAPGRIKGQRQ